jgi:hypothetical protein
MPLAGATIASAKQVFSKVTLVIDSICEEEITTEIMGPVRLMADQDQMAITVVSTKSRVGKPSCL